MDCIAMEPNYARCITRILRSDVLHAMLWEINAIIPFSLVMIHYMEVRSSRTLNMTYGRWHLICTLYPFIGLGGEFT